MDFAFTEEQELFRRTTREFALKELLPNYAYWDNAPETPWNAIRRMGEVGLTGLQIPEEFGGTPSDYVTLGIACEETARGDYTLAFLVMGGGNGLLFTQYAHESLQKEWLPRFARGEAILSGGITEPHCGSDAAAMTTRAVRDGDDWVITGEKASFSFSYAQLIMLFATIDPSLGPRGVTCFLIPRDTPGITTTPSKSLGHRCSQRGTLFLDHVRVPAKNILGEEGRAFYTFMSLLDHSRALTALLSVGAAQQTLDETVEYVKTRTAFGQPVARFQGVAFPIVEAFTSMEMARLLAYKVLWLADHHKPHGKESAMVKAFATRTAVDVVHQCLLLHGHAGYSEDYPIGQRMRDLIGLEIGGGTDQIMKLIAAQHIMGRGFRPG